MSNLANEMAGQTITEKIIEDNLSDIAGLEKVEVAPGREVVVDVSVLLTHDVCGPPASGIFKREFGKNARIFDRNKVVVIPDHYIFTCDPKARRNVDVMRQFAREQGINNFYDPGTPSYVGVCHTALSEKGHVLPGMVIVGTDSHTTTHGAWGTLSLGVGNTTGAYVMGSGHIIINTPESMKFEFFNKFPDFVMGKDVILNVIGDIGTDGADFKSMEFCGPGIVGLNQEERETICNMAIEAGGNGIIAPDRVTYEEAFRVGAAGQGEGFDLGCLIERYQSDRDARYFKEYTYNADTFEPMVAMPPSPGNVVKVKEIVGRNLNSAYLGSCTGGKRSDLYAAARLLHNAGRKVSIPLYVVPATTGVVEFIKERKIGGKTLVQIFSDAGADMGSMFQPSCAACLGGPKDTYGRINNDPKHVRISATNRNFPGRMGDGEVYLASPLTIAASALTGRITDPREFMQ